MYMREKECVCGEKFIALTASKTRCDRCQKAYERERKAGYAKRARRLKAGLEDDNYNHDPNFENGIFAL